MRRKAQDVLEDGLLLREQDLGGTYNSIRSAYGDRGFVNDLDIVNELHGHTGCVNALRSVNETIFKLQAALITPTVGQNLASFSPLAPTTGRSTSTPTNPNIPPNNSISLPPLTLVTVATSSR